LSDFFVGLRQRERVLRMGRRGIGLEQPRKQETCG
jgi:hypothetical protein